MALHQRLESLGSVAFLATPSPARPNLREVPNLLSWVSCFATCAAVLVEARPDLIKSHLAYLALIVAEARKHGGDGWQAYDSVFRQNAAHDPTADWSRLDTSLHAATFLAQQSDSGSFCQLCAATDHTHKDCALRPFSAPSTSHHATVSSPVPTRPTRPHPLFTGPPVRIPICIWWNKGECTQADCCYRHSCATCPGSHQAIECPTTNPGSNFKRATTQPIKRFQ